MSDRRTDRRRGDHRAFRPTLDGRLEPKILLSAKVHYPSPGQIQTAFNGQAVRLTTSTGQSFYIALESTLPGVGVSTTTTTEGVVTSQNLYGAPASPTGTIRAYRMSGGRFGLIVSGTNATTELSINPLYDQRALGVAHTFNPRPGNYTNMINIGSINVTSGTIGAIVGYRTAVLSGPIVATSAGTVDRIALDAILPGSSIFVGGDLNTLDVVDSATFSGAGTGISVGRDLNNFNVSGNLTITNNSFINVGRDVGLAAQPAKGTGPAGQGVSIQGNLALSNGGKFTIFRFLDANINVNGKTTGASNISANGGNGGLISVGGTTA